MFLMPGSRARFRPSNNFKLLNTLVANNSAALIDLSSFSKGFSSYEIVFINILPATTSNTLLLQVYSGGTLQNTGYITSANNLGGNAVITTNATVGFPLNNPTSQTNTGAGVAGFIRVSNPLTAGLHPWIGETTYNNGSTIANVVVSGYWNTSAAIQGFQINEFVGGNITSGTVKVYGLI